MDEVPWIMDMSLMPHIQRRALDAPRCTCHLYLLHTNLSSEDARVDSLYYEVGPDGVEDEERREQPVQNVVCWKHFHELRRLDCRAAEFYKLSWTASDRTFVSIESWLQLHDKTSLCVSTAREQTTPNSKK